jgi:hypothetical protein
MQIRRHKDLPQRMLHNWTQIYQRQLKKGKAYKDHVPVVCFWIFDNTFWNDHRWLHVFQCQDKETGRILHGDLCIVTVELPVWTKWLKAEIQYH